MNPQTLIRVVHGALQMMQSGPAPLAQVLTDSARVNANGEHLELSALEGHLASASAGDEVGGILRRALARWDYDSNANWTGATPPNSPERRNLIYERMAVGAQFIELCNARLPFLPSVSPIVIASDHARWYTPELRMARRFYWDAYVGQLRKQGWNDESIEQLDASTTGVLERLSDPTRDAAYQSKGLVVGYVQSGKTANFTGVIARAADAGYKLIIVLAGVLDVLRAQTQRRVDKDLVGKEQLEGDYLHDDDYAEFLSHGGPPSQLGGFDFIRLTGPDETGEYRQLGGGITTLQFRRHDPAKPLTHRDNLFHAESATRIAIVKKNSRVLQRILRDLRRVQRTDPGILGYVPALIIDDESDQASINTRRPAGHGISDAEEQEELTATNRAIVDLLSVLPRAQYLGYTATPFANVFVDPSSEENIFPKDFLITLPRPDGYMGVADFHDLDASLEDQGVRPNERDFVRDVTGDDDEPLNLQRAIDSFVLSGAIKLFRQSADERLKFKHHTMLCHSSMLTGAHRALAGKLEEHFSRGGYHGGPGIPRLARLFDEDFARVSRDRAGGLPSPRSFEDLLPHVAECITRIGPARNAVLTINNQTPDMPNFERQKIWKILVGGAKLSRGYTVEGLTVSYFRRRTNAADALMQMGRWFGFRRGYRDLCRLFIGRAEVWGARDQNLVDLYQAFGAVCRDEEMFREELRRYASMEAPRITPRQIPPLVPSSMLPPTAANKMFNARVTYRNFGGQVSESRFAPKAVHRIQHNFDSVRRLLGGKVISRVELEATKDGRAEKLAAHVANLPPQDVIRLLEEYKWFDQDAVRLGPMTLQIEFLKKTGSEDPQIDNWLLLAPIVRDPPATTRFGQFDFSVSYRGRDPDSNDTRLNTSTDPKHRRFAQHIAGHIAMGDPNEALRQLTKPRQAVLVYYPITDEAAREPPQVEPFSTGMTLLFPRNDIQRPITFGVWRSDEPDALVVDA